MKFFIYLSLIILLISPIAHAYGSQRRRNHSSRRKYGLPVSAPSMTSSAHSAPSMSSSAPSAPSMSSSAPSVPSISSGSSSNISSGSSSASNISTPFNNNQISNPNMNMSNMSNSNEVKPNPLPFTQSQNIPRPFGPSPVSYPHAMGPQPFMRPGGFVVRQPMFVRRIALIRNNLNSCPSFLSGQNNSGKSLGICRKPCTRLTCIQLNGSCCFYGSDDFPN